MLSFMLGGGRVFHLNIIGSPYYVDSTQSSTSTIIHNDHMFPKVNFFSSLTLISTRSVRVDMFVCPVCRKHVDWEIQWLEESDGHAWPASRWWSSGRHMS